MPDWETTKPPSKRLKASQTAVEADAAMDASKVGRAMWEVGEVARA